MNNTGPRGGCLFPLGLMALILAAALGACMPRAQAQQPVLPGKQICSNASGSTVCSFQPVTDASPLPVSATASIAGFNQETVLTPFTATTSGVTSGSFTAGKVIVVTNAGTTNMAYCRLGASATTSGQPIAPNGGWFAFTTVAETQVTCATSTSTTTINVGVGTGLPTGTGGGGGSGGGGAVTVADGADVTQGAIADAAVTAGGTGTLSAKLRYMTTQLDNINTNVQSAIPAGTNLIGDVNLRQGGTALSTTNGAYFNQLQGNAVLSATNPSFSRLTDGTNAQVTDPCQAVAKINFTGTQTTGTQIIAGTSSKKTYICSMQLIVQAAEVVNIIAGTGSVCATGTSVVMGSSTASQGMSYAANGGFTLGNGLATVIAATAANADNVCITQSGSSRITYQGTYVQL